MYKFLAGMAPKRGRAGIRRYRKNSSLAHRAPASRLCLDMKDTVNKFLTAHHNQKIMFAIQHNLKLYVELQFS